MSQPVGPRLHRSHRTRLQQGNLQRREPHHRWFQRDWRASLTSKQLGIAAAIAIVVVLYVMIRLILDVGYYLPWTGLDGQRSPDYEGDKLLWDWVELFFVPIVLLVGGIYLDRRERDRDRQLEVRRRQHEDALADARQRFENRRQELRSHEEQTRQEEDSRERTMQTYIDRMSDLLISGAFEDDIGAGFSARRRKNAQTIAVTRTLHVLKRLEGDTERQTNVLKFVRDAGMLKRTAPLIHFGGADLSDFNLEHGEMFDLNMEKADLSRAKLQSANFANSLLEEADFKSADLTLANMSSAMLASAKFQSAKVVNTNFSGANLARADFTNADIQGATFMGAHVTADQIMRARNYTEANLPASIATEIEKSN